LSGRCKSCNVVLFDEELTTKDQVTGQYLELCFKCQDIAENPDNVNDDYPQGQMYYEE